VASSSDARGVTKYTYDVRDRFTRHNPDGTYLAYGYDANGNVTQRSTPAGTASYAYDNLNRLIAVTGFDGKQTATPTMPTATASRPRCPTAPRPATYDALNRLTGIEHRLTASAAVIKGFAYNP
jgi:YD repeat-containing protein